MMPNDLQVRERGARIIQEMHERAKGQSPNVRAAYADCAMAVEVFAESIAAALEPIAPPDVAQAARVAAMGEILIGLLSCIHRPHSETKPDYWHVRAGKHVDFGIFASAALRAIADRETP